MDHPPPQGTSRPSRLTWLLLVVLVFLSFESILLAVAFKGAWFVLLAPGFVCGYKAWDVWREIKQGA
jgi:hypothetical protein